MFLILSLIIIVAAFNVITSLFILVKNKSREIALLKTIGTDNGKILRIFLLVGSTIGVAGTIIGSLLGAVITINLESIRLFLNQVFNLNLFPSEFYYIDQIPTFIDIKQIAIVILFSISISILATIYPAYTASRLEIKRILNNA
jgi:lipoprotein-releasing system permease protein